MIASTAQTRTLPLFCREHIHAYIPLPDHDHHTTFFSPDQFRYEASRDVYICPAGPRTPFCARAIDGPATPLPWRMSRSAMPAHSESSAPPTSRDAVCVAVWMRGIWIRCGPINPPNPTRKPCASAVCGWNRSSRDLQGLAWHAAAPLAPSGAGQRGSVAAGGWAKSQAVIAHTSLEASSRDGAGSLCLLFSFFEADLHAWYRMRASFLRHWFGLLPIAGIDGILCTFVIDEF